MNQAPRNQPFVDRDSRPNRSVQTESQRRPFHRMNRITVSEPICSEIGSQNQCSPSSHVASDRTEDEIFRRVLKEIGFEERKCSCFLQFPANTIMNVSGCLDFKSGYFAQFCKQRHECRTRVIIDIGKTFVKLESNM